MDENQEIVKRKIVKKGKKDGIKKKKKTLIAIGITAIALVVATYAWFIGVTRVRVNDFTVSVITTEGIDISLDGIHWDNNVDVSKGIIEGTDPMTKANGTVTLEDPTTHDPLYLLDHDTSDEDDDGQYVKAYNNNHWATAGNIDGHKGLEPVSSIGDVDSATSFTKFFAKTTMTSETGGYQLAAAPITDSERSSENYSPAKSYILFDLFIKNSTGTSYNTSYNYTEDESIYLVNNGGSYVKHPAVVTPRGAGIENSARVGFFTLGRVNASTTTPATIQSLDCSSDATGQTPLCSRDPFASLEDVTGRGYTWNIWEPNDKQHNEDAFTRYNSTCFLREGYDSEDSTKGDYDKDNGQFQSCDTLDSAQRNNLYVDTYAIKSAITRNYSGKQFSNIYDWHNGYENPAMQLQKTLKDSDNVSGDDRPALLHISPASITKIRVYIWLEGQDIDNYDLDSQYTNLKVQFGFTKEKITASSPSPSSSEESEPTETPTEPGA